MFNYSIKYVEGLKNVVANTLSRVPAGRNEDIPTDSCANADVRPDPEGETLPIDRPLECCAMQLCHRKPNGAVLKGPTQCRTERCANRASYPPFQCPETRSAPPRLHSSALSRFSSR
jgi:hypothetical protein